MRLSRYWVLVMGLVGVSVWAPSSVRAGGIAVESVAGQRAGAAASELAPIFEELGRRGYRSGASVGASFEKAGSRPSKIKDGLAGDFSSRVDAAYRLWTAGKFAEALAALQPLVKEARANPASLITTPALAESLFKAQVGVAMCHHRLGDDTAAWAAMAELVRSFDQEVSKGQYGAEASGLYQQVKKEAKAKASGGLSIRAVDSTAAIYLNERFAKIGELNRNDLVPGVYRVVAQLGPDLGRAYDVEVKPGGKADLVVDPAFESSVVTGNAWTGLVFRDRAEREQREGDAAARFGAALGELGVIVVGIDIRNDRTVAYGALVNTSTGKEIRRASVVIDGAPPPARLQALARFLVGEPTPLDGVEVHKIVARPRPSGAGGAAMLPEPPRPAQRRTFTGMRKLSLALGVAGLASAGVGLKFHLDAKDKDEEATKLCPNPDDGCDKSEEARAASEDAASTFNKALILYGVGGAALAGAITLWVIGGPSDAEEGGTALAPSLAPGYAGIDVVGRF